jgi:hypothetical protein
MTQELFQRQADDTLLVPCAEHNRIRAVTAGRSHPPTAHGATPMNRENGLGMAANSARLTPDVPAHRLSQPTHIPLPDRAQLRQLETRHAFQPSSE